MIGRGHSDLVHRDSSARKIAHPSIFFKPQMNDNAILCYLKNRVEM